MWNKYGRIISIQKQCSVRNNLLCLYNADNGRWYIKCVYTCMYANHLSVVAVVGIGRSTGVKVTHVLLQKPWVLRVLDRFERERTNWFVKSVKFIQVNRLVIPTPHLNVSLWISYRVHLYDLRVAQHFLYFMLSYMCVNFNPGLCYSAHRPPVSLSLLRWRFTTCAWSNTKPMALNLTGLYIMWNILWLSNTRRCNKSAFYCLVNIYICRGLIALLINMSDSVPGAERSSFLNSLWSKLIKVLIKIH